MQGRMLHRQERAVLNRLLSVDFPGRSEVEEQLRHAQAHTVDEDGSVRFTLVAGPIAPVAYRVPVEAEGRDIDGAPVHVLLHVVDGKVHELELYREDGARVAQWPDATAMEVFAPGDRLRSPRAPEQ